MIYVVQTRMVNTWENCWTENDKPLLFPTHDDALAEICDLLAEMPDYDFADYRIVKVTA
jgi:hypothetical protein